MAKKDLLDLASLSREEVEEILEQAKPLKDVFQRSVKKFPTLKGCLLYTSDAADE